MLYWDLTVQTNRRIHRHWWLCIVFAHSPYFRLGFGLWLHEQDSLTNSLVLLQVIAIVAVTKAVTGVTMIRLCYLKIGRLNKRNYPTSRLLSALFHISFILLFSYYFFPHLLIFLYFSSYVIDYCLVCRQVPTLYYTSRPASRNAMFENTLGAGESCVSIRDTLELPKKLIWAASLKVH